jgi:hypothetical protein
MRLTDRTGLVLVVGGSGGFGDNPFLLLIATVAILMMLAL